MLTAFWWALYCGPEYGMTGRTFFLHLRDGSAWWRGGRWIWPLCPPVQD